MKIILILSVLVVMATIGAGIVCMMKGIQADKGKVKRILRLNYMVLGPLMLAAVAILIPDVALAGTAETTTAAATAATGSSAGLGLIAAGLATGLACIGAGYAVGAVGSSAVGAVSEDPSILGKTLIFVGLAEGLPIYGLLISVLILGKI